MTKSERMMWVFAGIIISSVLWMIYNNLVLAAETTDLSEMAGCSRGQDLSNRFADGTATYKVLFVDGEVLAVECVK